VSTPAREALKQFACLGNVAEIAPLTLVHGETAMHAALSDRKWPGSCLMCMSPDC